MLLPVTALAQTTANDINYIYYTWDDTNHALTRHSGTATATDVTERDTSWGENDNQEHWYVVNGDITISSRISVTGDVHLILADGCKLTANGGIEVSGSLIIYGQSTDNTSMGKLAATGDAGKAGISGGTITIHGGIVTATGGNGGAGISGAGVTIHGGTVTATGGNGRAGISGAGAAAVVTIHGGIVTATGGTGGAGISGAGAVTIHGGTVTATGGNDKAGISSDTFSTTATGNAFIIASRIEVLDNNAQSGVIIVGNVGTVYGDKVTLTTDATIPSGKTLKIESDKTLTIGEGVTLKVEEGATLKVEEGATLMNEGTIIVYGELVEEVAGNGTIIYKVTGITIAPTTLSLDVDKTAKLQATITPDKATDKTVTWQSSDETIAKVDANGEVTAVSVGTVTITVTTADGSKTATCQVTVAHSNLKHFDRKEATCTEPGNIEYWYCEGCNKYFSDEAGKTEIEEEDTKLPATGHDWGKPVYKWSNDNTACTAIRTCKRDKNHRETAQATVTSRTTQAPTCTEPGKTTYTAKFAVDWAKKRTKTVADIPATGHHYANGYCTECGQRDPDYVEPIDYYNIYKENICAGVEVTTSNNVVREGGSIFVYVEKGTEHYTFDNFKVYYKRSYYGAWEELKEGTQPGEYPINNIWTHIYIKAEGAEEKEDPTGIESIEGVKVYTKDGSLYVQTPQREQVIIVSMSGAIVKNEEQVGLKQYHGLQPGIYIVRVGDRTYKVRLY